MHDVLKVEEVAELLRVSKATVQRWCAEGKLPAFKIGQHWRINGSLLNKMMADLSLLAAAEEALNSPEK